MKVAIYVRNSTSEERQNPETQLKPLKEYCESKQQDYDIFQEFISGSKESRPKLDKMMQGIRKGLYNKIIVLRLDRLGRSLKHLLQLIEEFKNRNVKFVSLTEGFDTSTPQGELFFSIAGAFAQFERSLTQERINDGIIRVKKEIEEKGFVITKEGKKIRRLGRPQGSKDTKVRRKSGYYQRWSKK